LQNSKQSEDNNSLPKEFALHQNYPNPFNPSTVIKFDLPEDSRVTLIVYDMLGRELTKLVDDVRPAGYHSITWNAKNIASGLYYYKLCAGNFVRVHKMMLLK
jgi:hypothetical protein